MTSIEVGGDSKRYEELDLTIIEAGKSEGQYWSEIWRFRELLFYLAWRDVLVRYKQTVIGVAWALLRPLIAVVVFTVVFGKIAALPSNGIPYPIFVFAALLPWQFFTSALSECSASLLGNAGVISKIYFPRLVIPASSIAVSFIDFAITFVIFIATLIWYGIELEWRLIFLPLFLLLASISAFGMGLWFAALNIRYRDVRFIVPFIIQLGMYVSPVGFSSSLVPEHWRFLYFLNPMAGVIDGFRWAIFGPASPIIWSNFALSLLVALLILLGGIKYFRGVETTFADEI